MHLPKCGHNRGLLTSSIAVLCLRPVHRMLPVCRPNPFSLGRKARKVSSAHIGQCCHWCEGLSFLSFLVQNASLATKHLNFFVIDTHCHRAFLCYRNQALSAASRTLAGIKVLLHCESTARCLLCLLHFVQFESDFTSPDFALPCRDFSCPSACRIYMISEIWAIITSLQQRQ